MATSGTTIFTMTRDEIAAAALRSLGAFGPQDTIPATDLTTAAEALNILVKAMSITELPLWCVDDIAVPLVVGIGTYDLSAATGTTLPLRVLDAYIRNAAGMDRTLQIISRYDYDTLGYKNAPGAPTQLYYDPQLGSGKVTVYAVPAYAGETLHVVLQRQIQDFNLSTDNPDFPQEALRMLKWGLMDELALEYRTPRNERLEINQRALSYRQQFEASLQEQASVVFVPTTRQTAR